jgi:hypothetical protein
LSTFTPSGSAGAVTTVTGSVSVVGATNPTIANVSMPVAATEYSYALPADTKKFYIKLRDPLAEIKLSYTAGASGTTYVTVERGNWYGEEDLSIGMVTLYFQSSVASQTLEIVSWV